MGEERKGKYSSLLKDIDIRRWHDNVARGSLVTADVYLRRLGSFCEHFNTNPRAFLSLNEGDLYNLMLDYVSWMEQKNYAGSYIKSALKAIKSWLSHNGIEIKRKIRIKGAEDTPTLKDERVPTQDELKRILLSGDKKARVACVLVAHSGLRIASLGNYSGDDGLTVGDFPEMKIEGSTIEFEHIPTQVVIRKGLSKAGHQYFSFLSEEGTEFLRDYLQERIRNGEKIGLQSAIITPKLRVKSFVRDVNVGDTIREAIRSAGFAWRPYVLRSYFDTMVMLCESRGHVLRDYRQFWMGHKGDIEARYTTNKCKLPEAVIEDMRQSYLRAQELLQATRPETSEEKIKDTFKRQILGIAGFSEKELGELNLKKMTDEELQTLVRKRLLGEKTNDCLKQKVIKLNQLENFLEAGWQYKAQLSSDIIVIERET